MVDGLTKNGVTLKSMTEPFDNASAAGKMMLQMLGVFAEFEHATIMEPTKVGMEKKAKGGQFVGGNVPCGFTLDPEKGLVVHEEEALLVRKMFKMYALGKEGASAICNQLNEAGHRNRNGRKWGRHVVFYMFEDSVHVGKIRWREVIYDSQHDPLVSEVPFQKASEVLQEQDEDLNARQRHNGDDRLLAGVIECAHCKSHMLGGGGYKKGAYAPDYVSSMRLSQHHCEQNYVRPERLETAVTEDIKAMFRDERFMARVWAEANKRLGTEKPILEKEIGRVEAQAAKAQAAMDRYFEALEAGSLKPELCNEKIQDLNARLQELEAEKRDLETRRKRLDLPEIDRALLLEVVDEFEKVMADGTNPQKKHLLHRLVKKVLVTDRRTVEVWYELPNPQRFEDWNKWLPGPDSNQRPIG